MAMTITGYFGGTQWDDSSRTYEIKTLGTKESGAILCGLNVSGKDKEGNKEYGKAVEVKINVKSEAEGSRVYGLISGGASMLDMEGFFVPNNYTNKEGKLIKGNQFLVFDSQTVREAGSKPTPSKPEPAEQIAEDELPW